MQMQKILIVEDDDGLNQALCYAAAKERYEPLCAYTLHEAKEKYLNNDVQLVVLDVNLPDGEGFSFCKWLKQKADVPVLFLTARDMEEDALAGYELGAEDYVVKPFSMKILFKKIGVILKRKEETQPGQLYFEDGFLKIDCLQAKVTVNGEPCVLTPTEFRLVQQFLANRSQLLTYDLLLERLWDSGGQFVDKHALAVNINRLRKKIEDGQHKYISNVYGMGYQWLG